MARELRCNAPVRTGLRSWTYLTTTARTLHVVLGLDVPGLGVGGVGGSALEVLELALRQVHRQVSSEPLLELRATLVRLLELG